MIAEKRVSTRCGVSYYNKTAASRSPGEKLRRAMPVNPRPVYLSTRSFGPYSIHVLDSHNRTALEILRGPGLWTFVFIKADLKQLAVESIEAWNWINIFGAGQNFFSEINNITARTKLVPSPTLFTRFSDLTVETCLRRVFFVLTQR